MLSLGQSYRRPSSSHGLNFSSVSSPPIIAPFWNDIHVDRRGGTIYYRQESDPVVAELVLRDISSQFPEAEFFHPSLVFVATWDRVGEYSSNFYGTGLVNTFQVNIVSDGTWTFVRFSYGDIQWAGSDTLIGVSAGNGLNFTTHPASLTSSVLLLDDTTVTYRVDSKFACMCSYTAMQLDSCN